MIGTVLFAITTFETENFAEQVKASHGAVVLTEMDWQQRQVRFDDPVQIKEALELSAIHTAEFGLLRIEGSGIEYRHTGEAGKSPTLRPRSYKVVYGERGLELTRIQPSKEKVIHPVKLSKGTCLLLTENIYSKKGEGHLLTVLELKVEDGSIKKKRSASISNSKQKSLNKLSVTSSLESSTGEPSSPEDDSLYYAFLDEDELVLTADGAGLAEPASSLSGKKPEYRRYCFDCIAKKTFDLAVPSLWEVDPASRALVVERMREHERIFSDDPFLDMRHHLRLYCAGPIKEMESLENRMSLTTRAWNVLKLTSKPEEETLPGRWLSADPASDPEADLESAGRVHFRFDREPDEMELARLEEVVSLNHVPDVDFGPLPTVPEPTPINPLPVEGKESLGEETELKSELKSSPESSLGSSSEIGEEPVKGEEEELFRLNDEILEEILEEMRARMTSGKRRTSWVVAAAAA